MLAFICYVHADVFFHACGLKQSLPPPSAIYHVLNIHAMSPLRCPVGSLVVVCYRCCVVQVPCPNALSHKGLNHDKQVFNTDRGSPSHLRRYTFWGKLAGAWWRVHPPCIARSIPDGRSRICGVLLRSATPAVEGVC
jgi:hypothetical protein